MGVPINPKDDGTVAYQRVRLGKDRIPGVIDSGFEDYIVKSTPKEISEEYAVVEYSGSLCMLCTDRRESRLLLTLLRVGQSNENSLSQTKTQCHQRWVRVGICIHGIMER